MDAVDEARQLAAAGRVAETRSSLARELLSSRRDPARFRRAAAATPDIERRFGDAGRALRLARLLGRVAERRGDRYLSAVSAYTIAVLGGEADLVAAAVRLGAAVELAGKEVPEQPEWALDIRADLATMLLYLGSVRDGAKLYEEVLPKAGGRTRIKPLMGLAAVDAAEGRRREAVRRYVRALREARKDGVADMTPEILLGLATSLRDAGRARLSLRVFHALERSGAERLGAVYWAERARAELLAGSPIRARLSARTALGFGASGFVMSIARLVLAELDLDEGRVAEALEGLAEAARLASGGILPADAGYLGRLLREAVERVKGVAGP